jgi:hypothetical protein
MSLLPDDWKYPVVTFDLNPDDPVVNTASEFRYQMATITHHTLTRPQTVVLAEDVTADSGKVFKGRHCLGALTPWCGRGGGLQVAPFLIGCLAGRTLTTAGV